MRVLASAIDTCCVNKDSVTRLFATAFTFDMTTPNVKLFKTKRSNVYAGHQGGLSAFMLSKK